MKITLRVQQEKVIPVEIEELWFECKVSYQLPFCYVSNLGALPSSGESFNAFFCFSVAVIACFLICWTPYHVQRMMFVILTRTDSWSSHLMKIQETLHIVSGKYYFAVL